ncbi:hypothetical protein EVAR_47194_1 [Eumeta japonica]|uniref:Uncharacterized protein n=1 Tax=Eumeta variegata TaxID=151549 RepID=A0A4C1WTS2_EUMVA|nr:hypothetical protein EVAR_47194_1 [Eumeta japonica]
MIAPKVAEIVSLSSIFLTICLNNMERMTKQIPTQFTLHGLDVAANCLPHYNVEITSAAGCLSRQSPGRLWDGPRQALIYFITFDLVPGQVNGCRSRPSPAARARAGVGGTRVPAVSLGSTYVDEDLGAIMKSRPNG